VSYIIKHEGKQFAPDGPVNVADVEAHNRQVEQQELAAWAAKPDRWQGYVNGNDVTTWRGIVIGTIYHSRKYVDGFGHRMQAIRFHGTNGESYYGRYGYDWSQFVRVRKFK
jgi:hypothetical protein